LVKIYIDSIKLCGSI